MPPKRRASSASSLSELEVEKTPPPATKPGSTKKSTPKRKVKKEEDDYDEGDGDVKMEPATPAPSSPARRSKRTPGGTASSRKKAKLESDDDDYDGAKRDMKPARATPGSNKSTPSSKATLAKKLKQLEAYLQTPFPDHVAPTPEQCAEVQDALVTVHGLPTRPDKLVDREGGAAGCGAVPDVLDALVRTILSQNTTSSNSTRAKNAMDEKYGRANYVAVHRASHEDLAETIACGGLANNKARSIKHVLQACVNRQLAQRNAGPADGEESKVKKEEEVEEKEDGDNGDDEITEISLDYLHEMNDLDAMKELVSFDGVGPKTASCVLLFCLGRNSFAVDTHVFRISKALGWVPQKANRETTFQHLDVRIPDEHKYPLHSLFVRHGRSCRLCSANGNITEAEVDSKSCPIKHILKRARAAGKNKGGPKENDNEEDGEEDIDDVIMPGQVRDKDEERGKPPIGGQEEGDVKPDAVWAGQIRH